MINMYPLAISSYEIGSLLMTTEYTIPMDPIRVILFRDHCSDNLRGKITKIISQAIISGQMKQ